MIYENLSDGEKRRFKKDNTCPICGKEINTTDNFQFLTFRDGRYTRYKFFHLSCLGKSNVKEVEITWLEEAKEKLKEIT